MKSIQSYTLNDDVTKYIEFASYYLKMSKTAVVEMIVRYIAAYDTLYQEVKDYEDWQTRVDDNLQYGTVLADGPGQALEEGDY